MFLATWTLICSVATGAIAWRAYCRYKLWPEATGVVESHGRHESTGNISVRLRILDLIDSGPVAELILMDHETWSQFPLGTTLRVRINPRNHLHCERPLLCRHFALTLLIFLLAACSGLYVTLNS